ncbi:hypothetical protein D3C77_815780 [compost metagenome]
MAMLSGSAGVTAPPGAAKVSVTTGALVIAPALLNVNCWGLPHTPPAAVVGAMAWPSIV